MREMSFSVGPLFVVSIKLAVLVVGGHKIRKRHQLSSTHGF